MGGEYSWVRVAAEFAMMVLLYRLLVGQHVSKLSRKKIK